MKLIEPIMEYSEQIQAYRQEFLNSGDSMDGTGGLRNFDDPQEWMHVFEWWGGEYRPLEELIAEMAEVRKNNG